MATGLDIILGTRSRIREAQGRKAVEDAKSQRDLKNALALDEARRKSDPKNQAIEMIREIQRRKQEQAIFQQQQRPATQGTAQAPVSISPQTSQGFPNDEGNVPEQLTPEEAMLYEMAGIPNPTKMAAEQVKAQQELRESTPEGIREKALREVDIKQLKSMAEQLPKLDRAMTAVDQLKNLWQQSAGSLQVREGNVLGGLFGKATTGIRRQGSALSGANPEFNRYLKNRNGFASLISKGGFMEAGVLTNQDIQRVVQLLPGPTTTDAEAEIAWKEIENVLGIAGVRFLEAKESFGKTGRTQNLQNKTGMIRVIEKSSGQPGNLPEEEFDPNLYDRI